METLLFATVLLVVGVVSTLFGYVLFRLLLPLMGFFTGFGIGFSGVQAVFGSNVWSYAAALITALLIGLLLAALAYFYYTFGVMVVVGSILAGWFAFFGSAIGLREEGFIVLLLSIAGAIIGGIAVLRYGIQHSLIVTVSAMFGIGAMLLSFFLLFGDVTVAQLHENGIISTIAQSVTDSWLWLFVFIGGVLFASALQRALIVHSLIGDRYMLEVEEKSKAKK